MATSVCRLKHKETPTNTRAYTVAVKTGSKLGAGTDANVYIRLNGTEGSSQDLQLKQSINHRNKFERNQGDVFLFHRHPNLGDLLSVQVWHDNSGPAAGWFLDAVEVHDAKADVLYKFPCNRWLAKSADDGQLSRFLPCKSKRVKKPKPSVKSTSNSSFSTEALLKSQDNITRKLIEKDDNSRDQHSYSDSDDEE